MAVTIVSTLPKAPQAVATSDSASNGDNAAASLDFASLLLGQLAPVAPPVIPVSTAQTASTENDGIPTDAASIIAALGLIPADSGRNVGDKLAGKDAALSAVSKTDRPSADSLATQATTGGLKAEDKVMASKTEPIPVGTLVADDKPAKFAVAATVASIDGVDTLKSKPADSTLNTPTLPTNLPLNSSHIPASRDPSLAIPTPVRDQNWTSDFSQKILWLANNDKHAAQLTLNPPQMGPIEISLTMDKGHATASFASANADVREAIETALPRLREMFANAGIQLGQTNVGAESFQQQAANGGANRSASQWMSDNAILVGDSSGSLPARAFATQQGSGMVDIFA